MIRCRFVGTASTIGEREFTEIGQVAVFSEDLYECAILGGAAFIPEADFQRIEFTAEELAAYGPAGRSMDPSESFINKVAMAQQVFRDIRSRMILEGRHGRTVSEISNGDAKGED